MVDTQAQSAVHFSEDLEKFCVIDIGSTTTKAVLFTRDPEWTFVRREAPTTVEKPYEDVTFGVVNALHELEQCTGETLFKDDRPCIPLYSTSSAGGGLAIVVAGLVRQVTSKSAERVALGAGAMILDVLALDDGRTPYKKIEVLESLRPDMLLLAGGFDGGAVNGPVFLAELFNEADLRPKLSPEGKLPVIYAGNIDAQKYVAETLSERFTFFPVPNLRPGQKQENLEPARDAIHEVFMDHVMSRAPGYERYAAWVDAPILPTPAAVSKLLALVSQEMDDKILVIDIGGATTDVFTAERGQVVRTVSANLGMSYSILNVVRQTGLEAIHETLDFEVSSAGLLDRIGNKYLCPTTLPTTIEDAKIECAVAAMAIREAVREHLQVISGLSISRGQEDLSWHYLKSKKQPTATALRLPNISGYSLLIGSGGKLSHTPRDTATQILLAALQPAKPVALAVDSAFIFPHLGVLAQQSPALALELFKTLGLVRLGEHKLPDAKTASSGKTSFAIPDAYSLPQRTTPLAQPSRITHGEINIRRELAIPGQVLVKPREIVSPEMIIARSTQTFLRPFFLRITEKLGIPPENLAQHLKKNVGDTIAINEVIAENSGGIWGSKIFRSPVAGTLEKILPNGTIIVREKSEQSTATTTVRVARDLEIKPEEIGRWMRCAVGDEVEQDQIIAAIGFAISTGKFAKSPVRGRIKDINLTYGVVIIEPLLRELQNTAWLPGKVTEITPRGCVIHNTGTTIHGIWGRGGQVSGILAQNSPRDGCILFKETTNADDLVVLKEININGLITGGVSLQVVDQVNPEFAIIITEGFGRHKLAPEIHELLAAHEGKMTAIDATTQLRAGVVRPRIILPNM